MNSHLDAIKVPAKRDKNEDTTRNILIKIMKSINKDKILKSIRSKSKMFAHLHISDLLF